MYSVGSHHFTSHITFKCFIGSAQWLYWERTSALLGVELEVRGLYRFAHSHTLRRFQWCVHVERKRDRTCAFRGCSRSHEKSFDATGFGLPPARVLSREVSSTRGSTPGPGPRSRGSLSPKSMENSSLAAADASGGLPERWRGCVSPAGCAGRPSSSSMSSSSDAFAAHTGGGAAVAVDEPG